jgi:hypothetical protein
LPKDNVVMLWVTLLLSCCCCCRACKVLRAASSPSVTAGPHGTLSGQRHISCRRPSLQAHSHCRCSSSGCHAWTSAAAVAAAAPSPARVLSPCCSCVYMLCQNLGVIHVHTTVARSMSPGYISRQLDKLAMIIPLLTFAGHNQSSPGGFRPTATCAWHLGSARRPQQGLVPPPAALPVACAARPCKLQHAPAEAVGVQSAGAAGGV